MLSGEATNANFIVWFDTTGTQTPQSTALEESMLTITPTMRFIMIWCRLFLRACIFISIIFPFFNVYKMFISLQLYSTMSLYNVKGFADNRVHSVFLWGGVAHLFSFLCCPIIFLYVLSSVLWCRLRFPHNTMFGSSLPPVFCRKVHILITLFIICVCFLFVFFLCL